MLSYSAQTLVLTFVNRQKKSNPKKNSKNKNKNSGFRLISEINILGTFNLIFLLITTNQFGLHQEFKRSILIAILGIFFPLFLLLFSL